ncbi:hypothetical protein JVU11DRAFT_3712 [Chiua virens]|nr:hypothetical protein JVU11DRAFT_3712 [Chiua virens]
MPRPQAPAGFVTIGPGIYISLTPTSGSGVALGSNDSAPNKLTVFLVGALTRHLLHYSRKYAELYPLATQIIVKCGASFVWTFDKAKKNRLLPVVEALEGLGCLPTTNSANQESTRIRPRILVHSFSNGGGIQLTTLGRLLSSKYPSIPDFSKQFVSALVIDSAPSIGNFRTIRLAFSIAIRNPVARYISLAIIYFLHALRLTLQIVLGMDMMAVQYIKTLQQPHFLPWTNSQTPRLYVFSKKDEVVPWQEVQRHAEAAKMARLTVRCELYEESAHVAHMRLDPKRYWGSIQDLWQLACLQSQAKVSDAA